MPPEGLTPLSISEFAAKYGPIMEIVGMSRQGVKDILAMAYGVFPLKRKKSIGDGLNARNDAASIYDGEGGDNLNSPNDA